MNHGELFIRALMEAIPKVPKVYFKCSNANREVAENYSQDSPIKKAAFTHGERAFCYELYHELRISLNTLQKNIPESRKLVLHGELKKRELQAMTEKHCGLRQLDKEFIPDFLLHVPKDGENQEVVMEVKSAPKLQFNHVHVDLKKIDQFISRYRYKMGLFLAVNINEEDLLSKLRKYETRLRETIENISSIHIIVNESPDKKVFRAGLLDILK